MEKTPLRQKLFLSLSAVIILLIILEAVLRISGSLLIFLQEQRNRFALKETGAYRIMCIGDSVTFGLNARGKDSYPSQLEEILNQNSRGIKFKVINKAVPAAKTTFIVSQLEKDIKQYRPHMVIAMMGVNDREEVSIYAQAAPIAFWRCLRIYKLARAIWLRLIDKLDLHKGWHDAFQEPAQLTRQFMVNGQYSGCAELSVEKGGKENPYLKAGRACYFYGRYQKAAKLFRKSIAIEPYNYTAHLLLARSLAEEREYAQAEEVLKKIILADPGNYCAYIGLGWIYYKYHDYNRAEDMFKRACGINPDDAWLVLGNFYYFQNEYGKAEKAIKEAIEAHPDDYAAYAALAKCYSAESRHREAIEMCKKTVELDPQNSWGYGALALLYNRIGQARLAEEYSQKANRLRLAYFNPVTRYNYNRLKEITDKWGVKLVCAQYPMRSVNTLKKMFVSTAGVIFVDNEGVFKDALMKSRYEDYFSDMLGGDFGHCTKKGNRLLAENIADTILRDCFKSLGIT